MNLKNTKSNISFLLPLLFFLFIFSTATLIAEESILTTVGADDFFSVLEQERVQGRGILLDVRTPGEYADGNAPTSENIDFYGDDFQNIIGELDRNEAYFLYCRSGNRSGRSLKLMKTLGFHKVYDLSGGWSRNAQHLLAVEEL
ncbi:MAG: rhodanese-like domain-containing protein [Spirochaetaceae bacterium]|nr:rhodanese-like domain-containing protein [Spirochaetaceae bacterium]